MKCKYLDILYGPFFPHKLEQSLSDFAKGCVAKYSTSQACLILSSVTLSPLKSCSSVEERYLLSDRNDISDSVSVCL